MNVVNKFYRLPNIIFNLTWDVADKVNREVDANLSDQGTGVLHLVRGNVFAELPKNTGRTGFNSKLNTFTACTFHFDDQLFVNCGDTRLTVPEDVDFLSLQQRAEFKDPLSVSSKSVVTHRKID